MGAKWGKEVMWRALVLEQGAEFVATASNNKANGE
jgi:hypothetical protein